MKIREIRSLEELKEFQARWVDFTSGSPCVNPYASFEWVCSDLETYKRGEILILVAEDEGRVCAIAALESVKSSFFGVPYKTISFVGTGPTETVPRSSISKLFSYDNRLGWADMADIYYNQDNPEGIAAIIRHLKENTQWDVLDLREMPPHTPCLEVLDEEFGNKNFIVERKVGTTSSVIEVPENFEDYTAGLSKRSRKNINLSRNRIKEQLGEVELNLFKSKEEIEPILPRIMELEKKSWKGQQGVGAFSRQDNRDFHLAFARRYSEAGLFRLFTLEAKNVMLAYGYMFQGGACLYSHNMALNPEYPKLSPGMAMLYRIIEHASVNGIREVSFGRGLDHFIEAMITRRDDRIWTKIYRNTFLMKLLHKAEFSLAPLLRKLKESRKKKEAEAS